MVADGPRTVLIVEDRAHWESGHYGSRAPQLAAAYAELGYEVEILTSHGWSRAAEHPDPPFTVARYRAPARWLDDHVRHRGLRSILQVAEIRARSRRAERPPAAVIVLSLEIWPTIVALGAPRRGHWLVNVFGDPRPIGRWHALDRLAMRLERWRHQVGGRVRVAVSHEARRTAWSEQVPFLSPVVAPIAGVRRADPAPDARVRLGLPANGRVALFFGDSGHKRPSVVDAAFTELDDWTLVVGGTVADMVRDGPRRRIVPSPVSDTKRDLLFAAADLVVLSFIPGYLNNSGTLMDAISFGVPVVCSADAAVARSVVTRYRMGTCFDADDPRSLAEAVRRAPRSLDHADLEAVHRELSNQSIARNQLELLEP
jgi:glycosyltransferase involved in cell wall biosynthesis